MFSIIRRRLGKIAGLFGLQIKKIDLADPIVNRDTLFNKIYAQCKPYTMTSKERMYALFKAVEYIVKAGIHGDFVECGVWRGGSAMLIALTLKELNVHNKKIYLYDTFEGMSEPTSDDYMISDNNRKAEKQWQREQKENHNEWCYASLEDVTLNMSLTKYPKKNIVYVKGKVEETIPENLPSQIALLRLDTDWYESTRHELTHLFPLLVIRGVLIIDDYGFWAGSKKAVDEYFAKKHILLNRIDYTGRIGVKIES